ncbi:hypothetical protein RI129_000310 [Pyrocoelia pectoralis]|uniref:Major facilitator superfamily (MFS) profile domain-containing protein n=1 Tax=Pyrocoelia pectoralis TaxID=417401 RepID=A0AAN7ZVL3_9COLE
MGMAYIGILIPSLTDPNSKEIIYLNEAQTSWTGSITSISALIGSLLSGPITDPLGRKPALIILTIPFMVSSIGYYFAKETWHIYATLVLHGMAGGLVEAPILTYVAEITEPSLRGSLSSTSLLSLSVGIFLEFLIGSMLHWRTVALVTCIVSLATLVLLLSLPETPYWLLSRNKPHEARKSLAWLRGWTTVENVEQEFQEIQKSFTRLNGNTGSNKVASIKVTKMSKFQQCCKRDFLQPFSLIALIIAWSNFIGLRTTETYSVIIFNTLNVPINGYYATVIMSLSSFVGTFACFFVVQYCGKRKAALGSSLIFCICCTSIGIYAYINDIIYFNFKDVLRATPDQEHKYSWIPVVLFATFGFFGNCGPKNLPWTLAAEVFSNDLRAIGCGLVTSVQCLSLFVVSVGYLDTAAFMSFPGLYWTFACVCAIGVLIIYFCVPETEDKTLAQIEDYYKRSTDNNLS